MRLASVCQGLLWCTILNSSVLFVWWRCFLWAHDGRHGWHSQWFHLSRAQFDAVHYAGMALYKLGILLRNLVPSLALHMIGRAEAHRADNP